MSTSRAATKGPTPERGPHNRQPRHTAWLSVLDAADPERAALDPRPLPILQPDDVIMHAPPFAGGTQYRIDNMLFDSREQACDFGEQRARELGVSLWCELGNAGVELIATYRDPEIPVSDPPR